MQCIRLLPPVILAIASALSLGFLNWCHVVKFPKSVGSTKGMYLSRRITLGFWGHSSYFWQEGGPNPWNPEEILPTEWKVGACKSYPDYIDDAGTLDAPFQAARVFSILTPIFAVLSTVLVCGVKPFAFGTARKLICIPVLLAALSSGLTLLIFLSDVCNSSSWQLIEQNQTCELDAGAIVAIVNMFLFKLSAILMFISAETNIQKPADRVQSDNKPAEEEPAEGKPAEEEPADYSLKAEGNVEIGSDSEEISVHDV